MRIDKWLGLITAASPYALPPGAAAVQNNLQITKPGQLTPRPGMSALPVAVGSTVRALHRQAPGGSTPDRLVCFRVQQAEQNLLSYSIEVLQQGGNTLNAQVIHQFQQTTPNVFPSFTQDRHGNLLVFYGYGIAPSAYRHGIDSQVKLFGLIAPTVAPQITPEGDGWFIERVDVLQTGGSYWTPPILTVTGGSPDRNAILRAVVQAGAIVAVEIEDGGSNFKDVPSIEIGATQIGTGFLATGMRGVGVAVYGFRDTAAPAAGFPTGTYDSANTHSFSAIAGQADIAYRLPNGGTQFVSGTFNPVSAEYTALIPLTPSAGSSGTGAFAEVKFNPRSAAYRLGNVNVDYQPGIDQFTTPIGSALRFRARRVNWHTANDYFENTYTPVNAGYTPSGTWKYHHGANKDAFWGLMPYPDHRKFAKRQLSQRWWQSGNFWQSGKDRYYLGNYYYPDYSAVGYRVLVGPESDLANPNNWVVLSAPVQFDGNGLPFIDAWLRFPAKDPQGTSRPTTPATLFPVVRIYLTLCPDAWTVSNTPPVEANDRRNWRFAPQSGLDRRQNFNDPGTGQGSLVPSGVMEFYDLYLASAAQLQAADTHKRWWGPGFVNAGNPADQTVRPLSDTRRPTVANTPGLNASTLQLIYPGAQIAQGTKFVLRLEQYNAFDYRVTNEKDDWGPGEWDWFAQPPEQAQASRTIPASADDFQRRGAFGSGFIDFYFEANELDTTGGSPELLLPGAVKGTPRVVLSGAGWGPGQSGAFTLRQRPTTVASPVPYTDSVTYQFSTEEITPAVSGNRIESVVISSQGQNYYREPQILFRGGGGYGLRTQARVENGRVVSVIIVDGGDGFTSDTVLYTDVQPAKLFPAMRGTLRGTYRCAYRFADYSQTLVKITNISLTTGSKQAFVSDATGIEPGMQITNIGQLRHLTRIVSVAGNQLTLSHAALGNASSVPCGVRDMTRPIVYSDFSPITDVTPSNRAARFNWSLAGVTCPPRADYIEFYRTSADQSLVFYRLEQYGNNVGGVPIIVGPDSLSDEELFDIDRPAYAALPVVLPNGGLNAYRFGVARSDMAVCVAWEDRLWYGVSTSGQDSNTVFFSELDEFESCPDLNELPIQSNLRSSDFLTALVPFGPVLLAMQNSHSYSISYNTDPSVDPVITLVAHRGCFNQRTWDIFDDLIYAADERGVYSMSKSGEVRIISEPIRDFFSDDRLDLAQRASFHLRVDQTAGVLRLFVCLAGAAAATPHIALCYHIRNNAWWTETWPNSLTCASDYRPSGGRETMVCGAIDGGIYELSGRRDYPFGDVVSVTVTNGGSGYVTPPTITLSGQGRGAELRALIQNGQVTEVLVVNGGFGYGERTQVDQPFNPVVGLTFSSPPQGTTAQGFATARQPNLGTDEAPIRPRSSVPFSIRTGAMTLASEGSVRGGDRQIDRSITITYRPTSGSKTLALREYYNNSESPRPNVMRRDRGTGFVHDTDGAKTTLDMDARRSALGLSTGMAKAMFAGRSLEDVGSADRHIAIDLSCDTQDATAAVPPEPLIYELDIQGVIDGGE